MNRDCVHHLLPDYQEGNLPDAQMRSIQAHLQTCRACRDELDYLNHIQTFIRRKEEPAPGLWADLAPHLQNETTLNLWTQFEWVGRRLVPILAAAAVLMLAVLGSLNTDAQITLEEYLTLEWDTAAPESLVLSQSAPSRDDILRLTASASEPAPQEK